MKLATIVPFNDLERFSRQDKVHLVLAHLVGDNRYTEFYKEMKGEGHYVLLDNGAWEHLRPCSSEELLRKVEILQPSAVVCPDYPYQPYQKTIDACKKFQDELRDYTMRKKLSDTEIIFCPQSEENDILGLLNAYHWASDQSSISTIALSILNCPIAMGVHIHSEAAKRSRVKILEFLLVVNLFSIDHEHHLLGCFYPKEIEEIEKLKRKFDVTNIESIDTSLPVICGIRGVRFDESKTGLEKGKPTSKLDFSQRVLVNHWEDVMHNILYLKKMAKEHSR